MSYLVLKLEDEEYNNIFYTKDLEKSEDIKKKEEYNKKEDLLEKVEEE